MSPIAVVAYVALFVIVGFSFVFVSLLLGWFFRAQKPSPQKQEIYECGEPSIGSGFVQFDLRFYVVALLFLIFEVEVAFFFPPAIVFGKAIQGLKTPAKQAQAKTELVDGKNATANKADIKTDKIAVSKQPLQSSETPNWSKETSLSLARAAMIDLGIFFGVLLIGFAFLWRRGDLNWVRASHHPATPMETAALAARLRQENF